MKIRHRLKLRNKKYSIDILYKHKEYFSTLDWILIGQYQELSIDFIIENLDKLSLFSICLFQRLPVEFIRLYRNKLMFNYIYFNKNINIMDKLLFSGQYDWDLICNIQVPDIST